MNQKNDAGQASDRLQVRLLGQFQVTDGTGTRVTLPTQKAKAFFAMIVLAGSEGLDRASAAGLLWSRGSDAQARTNLRQTLASLRKALGDAAGALSSEGSLIRVDGGRVISDTAIVLAGDETELAAIAEGLGPLLDGVRIDEPGFDDWLTLTRATWQNRVSVALFELAEGLVEKAAYQEARRVNQTLLTLDPFDEGAHRQTMRILSGLGTKAQALRHFDDLAALLKEALGIEPSAATKELVASLRRTEPPNAIKTISTQSGSSREKTLITVAPFAGNASDGEDGFGEDLSDAVAAGLGRFATLRISRQCAPVSNEGFVVEGRVRHAGGVIRVTAQLSRAATRDLIWSEQIECAKTEGFEALDAFTNNIVAALPGRIQGAVAESALRRDVSELSAHELMLRGKLLRDALSGDAMQEARGLLERAIALEPDNARAQMYLSDTYVVDGWLGLSDAEGPAKALYHARLAVAADPLDVFVQDHLGFAFLSNRMWQDGQAQIERTLEKIGNEVESNAWCGYALLLLGEHDTAMREVLRSTARDPMPPASFGWIKGQVFAFAGRNEEAIAELMGASALNSLAHAFLVGAYARLGRADDARVALAQFIARRMDELEARGLSVADPSIEAMAGGYRGMWKRCEDFEHIAEGLALAGLKA